VTSSVAVLETAIWIACSARDKISRESAKTGAFLREFQTTRWSREWISSNAKATDERRERLVFGMQFKKIVLENARVFL